ncbi:MAG: polyprenyl synthetase family protein, partial [Xanthomarina gelatinilytica]|nr:polyprenyl synthetase family protein [Xanthomarina gelatinilytica]
AMKMGAIVAQATKEDQDIIYEFGKNLGIAFQLQDDYLDVFGDPKTFGKQVGGDIIENKKTYLYLKAVEFSEADKKTELQHLYSLNTTDHSEKIKTAKQIFVSSGSAEATKKAIEAYTNKAFTVLDHLNVSEKNKLGLIAFGKQLMGRNV